MRDFLYIDDFTNLIIKILKKNKIRSGIYNVGCGTPIRVRDVIIKFKRFQKVVNLICSIQMRSDETPELFPDIEKTSSF